ncbi:hypothetical protein BGP75_09000 [Motiliproteus sp. MSK22-1]|nr:hypothetical protein BGP75_09000 [Motiliproteus sp. MSK22-1]
MENSTVILLTKAKRQVALERLIAVIGLVLISIQFLLMLFELTYPNHSVVTWGMIIGLVLVNSDILGMSRVTKTQLISALESEINRDPNAIVSNSEPNSQ